MFRETGMLPEGPPPEERALAAGQQFVPTLTPADVVAAGYGYDDANSLVVLLDGGRCTIELLAELADGWRRAAYDTVVSVRSLLPDEPDETATCPRCGIVVYVSALIRDGIAFHDPVVSEHGLLGTVSAICGALPGECG